MPLGPSDVRTISAIVFAAVMLFLCAWFPLVSDVPSFKTTMGTCPADIVCSTYVSNNMWLMYYLYFSETMSKKKQLCWPACSSRRFSFPYDPIITAEKAIDAVTMAACSVTG
jgi:hypothetical protein